VHDDINVSAVSFVSLDWHARRPNDCMNSSGSMVLPDDALYEGDVMS